MKHKLASRRADKATPTASLPGTYTVSWTGVTAATSYRLEEQVNGGGWAEVQNGASLSKAYATKASGTYGYRARGCNVAGCGPYAVVVSTLVYPLSVVTAPATNDLGNYSISWTAVTSATSYRLEESINSGGWTEISNAAATSKALTNKPNGTYQYRVRACSSAGCGGYSAVVTTVVQLVATVPPVPTGISGSATSAFGNKTRYILSWSASANATYYEVWPASLGCGPGQSCLFTRNGGYLPITFQVHACNQNGCSAWSAPVTTVFVQ